MSMTSFSQIRIFVDYTRDNNGIIYKNLLFKIRFQKLQHIIVVLLSGFCWKQSNVNAPLVQIQWQQVNLLIAELIWMLIKAIIRSLLNYHPLASLA